MGGRVSKVTATAAEKSNTVEATTKQKEGKNKRSSSAMSHEPKNQPHSVIRIAFYLFDSLDYIFY